MQLKGVDTDLTIYPIVNTTNTNGSCFPVNVMSQGPASYQRVSRYVHNHSLNIRGYFSFVAAPTAATGVALNNVVRMVVVWDKFPQNLGQVAYDVIFGVTTNGGAEACLDIISPLRYDNMDRFRVIADELIECNLDFMGNGTAPQQVGYVPYERHIPLNGLTASYSSNFGTNADIATGLLTVYFRAIQQTTVINCGFDGTARLRYYN